MLVTDMCVLLPKKCPTYYVNQRNPVFSVILDASNAFDRTNHITAYCS